MSDEEKKPYAAPKVVELEPLGVAMRIVERLTDDDLFVFSTWLEGLVARRRL